MSLHSDVVWDLTEYTLKKLAKLGAQNLPFLMRLIEGYEGIDECLVYSCDDIYWVTRIETQNMMMLKDERGKYMSIPLDADISFCLDRNKEILKVKDLVNLKSGSKVRMWNKQGVLKCFQEVTNEKVQSILSPEALGSLVIVHVYENRLLQCHSVLGEKLDSTVHRMPLYLPLHVVVANDVKSSSKTSFRQLIENVKSIENRLVKKYEPFNKINIFEKLPSDKSDYEFMSPEMVGYVNSSSFFNKPLNKLDENEYDCIPVKKIGATLRPLKAPAPPPICNRVNIIETKKAQQILEENKRAEKKQLPLSPILSINPNHSSPCFNDESEIFLQQHTDPSSQKNNPFAEELEKKINKIKIRNNECAADDLSPAPRSGKIIPASVVKPFRQNDEQNKISPTQIFNQFNSTYHTSYEIQHGANLILNLEKNDLINPKASRNDEPPDLRDEDGYESVHLNSEKPPFQRAPPLATLQSLPISNAKFGCVEKKSRWNELSEVPKDISCMSVEEVASILRLFNMDEAIICKFIENEVDGKLLEGLDAQIFSEQFNLDKLQTLKLCKFVQEKWRPLKVRSSISK